MRVDAGGGLQPRGTPLTATEPAEQKQIAGPLMGAFLMIVSAAFFAGMNGMVRLSIDEGMHQFQVAFLRSVFALAFTLPFLLKAGLGQLKTRRWKLYLLRGTAATTAMMCWMTAVATIPLAEATAMSFTAPLIATMGSALILKEQVRARRWGAVFFGFIGVLIILRPGYAALEPGSIAAIGAAFAMATAALSIKALTDTEPAGRVVFYTSLMLTLFTLPFAIAVWIPMTPTFWLYGLLLGFFGVTAQFFLTKSFSCADASIVMPFDYSRLPFVALVGWVFFGEVVSWITWLGAAIIVGSAMYVVQRERALAKPPTKLYVKKSYAE